MKNGKRNYKAELKWEKENKPNRVKDRAERNRARREAGLGVGDPRVADHKKPLSEGGARNQKNVRIISAKENLAKEARRKQRKAR